MSPLTGYCSGVIFFVSIIHYTLSPADLNKGIAIHKWRLEIASFVPHSQRRTRLPSYDQSETFVFPYLSGKACERSAAIQLMQ